MLRLGKELLTKKEKDLFSEILIGKTSKMARMTIFGTRVELHHM